MTFKEIFGQFRKNEDGAVTVDWVVLTASIVGLGVAVLASVGNSASSRGDDISSCLGRIGWNMDSDNGNWTYAERLERAQERCELDNL